jgi:hypothetical protein
MSWGSGFPPKGTIIQAEVPSKAWTRCMPWMVTSERSLFGRFHSQTRGASMPLGMCTVPVMRTVLTLFHASLPPLASTVLARISSRVMAEPIPARRVTARAHTAVLRIMVISFLQVLRPGWPYRSCSTPRVYGESGGLLHRGIRISG